MGLSLGGPSVSLGPKNRILGALGLPGASDFATRDLWGNGEQGVWFDPSDFERYMAPKGPERLANFDFTDGAANWIVENADATHTITFNAGTCRYVSDTTSPILSLKQNGVYTAGSWYEVVVVISAWVSGSIKIDASGVTSPGIGAVGTHRFTAQATGGGFQLYRNSADVDITIDSISVRELTQISTASLFQDAAGTTPVTAMEQPVGLMLDKRLGLVRGPELCTDPQLNTPGAWSFSGATPGWTVTGGRAEVTATAAANRWLSNGGRLTIGKTYEVLADVVVTAGGVRPDMSATNAGNATTSGPKRWIVVASTLSLQFLAEAAFIGSIDNISVREIPGNHASQATTTARPLLSARKNLLIKTEQLTDAAWVKTAATVVGDTITEDGTNAQHHATQIVNGVATVGGRFTVTLDFRQGTGTRNIALRVGGASGSAYAVFNPATGALVTSTTSGANWSHTTTPMAAVATDDGWFTASISVTSNETGQATPFAQLVDGTALTYLGNSTSSIRVRKMQIEYGPSATRYQRVNTATDYDWVGFPMYLKFDGVDDTLTTATFISPGTDKAAYIIGLAKASDATAGFALGYSTGASNSSDGSFALHTPPNPNLARYGFEMRGTAVRMFSATASPYSHGAGPARVLSCRMDAALAPAWDSAISVRVNGATPVPANTSDGVGLGALPGNFGAHPLAIGRAAAGGFLNGAIYSVVFRFGVMSSTSIIAAERAVAAKTGVTL